MSEPTSRDLYLYGTISIDSVKPIIQKMIAFSKEDLAKRKTEKDPVFTPIVLHINSFGGAVGAAFALIDTMSYILTPVVTVVEGSAYSCGSLIALSGDYRIVQPNAYHLIHSIASGRNGMVQDLRESMVRWDTVQEDVDRLILTKTKVPIAKLDHVVTRKQDWYIGAKEAIELGLADAIQKPRKVDEFTLYGGEY